MGDVIALARRPGRCTPAATHNLERALTAITQLLLVMVAGIVGAPLAAPLATVIIVLVTMLYVHDVLSRRDVGPASSDTPTLPA